jgi:hypothetical protein
VLHRAQSYHLLLTPTHEGRDSRIGRNSCRTATVGYLVDLIAEVQVVRSCIIAAEHDPQFTPIGYCVPNHAHLAAGGISLLKARQLMSEQLRIVPDPPW